MPRRSGGGLALAPPPLPVPPVPPVPLGDAFTPLLAALAGALAPVLRSIVREELVAALGERPSAPAAAEATRWMTTGAAARALGVQARAIRARIDRRTLRAERRGGRLFVRADDVAALGGAL